MLELDCVVKVRFFPVGWEELTFSTQTKSEEKFVTNPNSSFNAMYLFLFNLNMPWVNEYMNEYI
jgi:hypothetical protein